MKAIKTPFRGDNTVPRLMPIVLGLAALALAACANASPSATPTNPSAQTQKVGAGVDMPVYSSIEQLSGASDLVVLGTVEGVVAREVDYGTANPDGRRPSHNYLPLEATRPGRKMLRALPRANTARNAPLTSSTASETTSDAHRPPRSAHVSAPGRHLIPRQTAKVPSTPAHPS